MKLEPRKFVASAAVCALGCRVSLRAVRGLPELLGARRPRRSGRRSRWRIALFTRWLIPFEIVGLILLVGIVGAVVLAKRGE